MEPNDPTPPATPASSPLGVWSKVIVAAVVLIVGTAGTTWYAVKPADPNTAILDLAAKAQERQAAAMEDQAASLRKMIPPPPAAVEKVEPEAPDPLVPLMERLTKAMEETARTLKEQPAPVVNVTVPAAKVEQPKQAEPPPFGVRPKKD